MSKITMRLGGVPEHFNFPFYRINQKQGLSFELDWIECPAGTGQMNSMLEANELDMAIMLTEGAVWNILKGSDHSILEFYTLSPLRWGIHTGAKRDINHALVLENKRFAISRIGSGSHLMATVYGMQLEQDILDDQWDIIHDIHGGVEAVTSAKSDFFLWEKFTTKPYVDKGQLKIIGEVKTPWPCFVLVVRNDYLNRHPELIEELRDVLQDEWESILDDPSTCAMIAEKFGLKVSDVEEWYEQLEWNTKFESRPEALKDAVEALKKVGRLPKEIDSHSILSHYVGLSQGSAQTQEG